ncbi:hypothetical protein BDV98DRAFT_607154 [Pterulicium gracile]|uniref:BTB domain-containing protein n=1 Tax=Pterulicium gracile TaxID=1884261 RepID=A0A5C3QCH6_9AGAR|nr:hypothetical protein BDV98DRAFT_607154 [Pterula gracilis]
MEPLDSDAATTSDNASSEKSSPHPDFLPSSTTDLVLQSSDAVEFHVSKPFLAALSTIFSDMLRSSELSTNFDLVPPHENVVQMSEDSTILALLLRWIHPHLARKLRISSQSQLQDATKLLTLAEKYDICALTMRIEDHLITLIVHTDAESGDNGPTLAFRIYCIAYRFQLAECAKEAALRTLPLPFHSFISETACKEETSLIGIADLASLAKYHSACCKAARDTLDPHIFCTSESASPGEIMCVYHRKRHRSGHYSYYGDQGSRLTEAESARWRVSPEWQCEDCGDIGFVPWLHLLFSECRSLCTAKVDLRDIVEQVFDDERFGESVGEAEGECGMCRDSYAWATIVPRIANLQRVIREEVLSVIQKVEWGYPSFTQR